MLPSTRRENHEISWSSWNCLRLLTFEFTKSSSKVRCCCLRYWLNEELQLCFQRRDYASVVGAWALHAYILCSSLRLCFFLCLWWGGWVWCQAALSPGPAHCSRIKCARFAANSRSTWEAFWSTLIVLVDIGTALRSIPDWHSAKHTDTIVTKCLLGNLRILSACQRLSLLCKDFVANWMDLCYQNMSATGQKQKFEGKCGDRWH